MDLPFSLSSFASVEHPIQYYFSLFLSAPLLITKSLKIVKIPLWSFGQRNQTLNCTSLNIYFFELSIAVYYRLHCIISPFRFQYKVHEDILFCSRLVYLIDKGLCFSNLRWFLKRNLWRLLQVLQLIQLFLVQRPWRILKPLIFEHFNKVLKIHLLYLLKNL